MLDEEMDHIIRDAAEMHHPAYHDKAWEMMEKKLDKHLPQKKDRRKFIFFLLFFLLLGVGTVLSVIYLTGDKTTVSSKIAENKTAEKPASASTDQKIVLSENTDVERPAVSAEGPGNNNTGELNSQTPGNNTANVINKEDAGINREYPEKSGTNRRKRNVTKGRSNGSTTAAVPFEESVIPVKDPAGKKGKARKQRVNDVAKMKGTVTPAKTVKTEIENTVSVPVPDNSSEEKIVNEQEKITDKEKGKKEIIKEAAKEKEPVVVKEESSSTPDKKKTKNNFAGNFGITVSAGPDLSYVSLNKLGKLTLMYGAGLSYKFAKKFTVRTGFYFSKKIYSATPEQYHTPGGNYPNLYNVAANCKVYEIPLSISYQFGQKNKHNWFGNAGLSSFLMKKENYDYLYKTPAGQTYNYKSEINNENKHYFAVLTLSGGYQYYVSKRVSLQAEPYVKIPLAGVGSGKIKLNSSGILFTATVKPFMKKK